MKNSIALIFLVLFYFANAPEVFACSCKGPVSPQEEFERSTIVFVGHVTNLPKAGDKNPFNVKLQVDKVWKGAVVKGDVLDVGMRSDCTFWKYENDTSYLIYATQSPDSNNTDRLDISSCSLTKRLDEGQIETRYLDALLLGQDTAALDLELPKLLESDGSADIRAEAARMLSWFQWHNKESLPEGTVAALIKATRDPESKVREVAASALSISHPRGAEIKTALLGLLADRDEQVRRNAADALTMNAPKDSETYQALLKSLNKELSLTENKSKYYENTLAGLGVSLLKAASSEEEKIEAISNALGLLDKVQDSYPRGSLIQQIGFMGPVANVAAPKFISTLKDADQYFLKTYTIQALADIGAVDAYDTIAALLPDENCYVTSTAIMALKKLNPEQFKQGFPNEIKPLIERKFDQCRFIFINILRTIGEDTKSFRPFLLKKYQEMSGAQDYEKDAMKQLLATFDEPSTNDFSEIKGPDIPHAAASAIEKNPRYEPKVLVANNQIFSMKVSKSTNTALDLEIDYNYDPQGEDWANLSAGLLYHGNNLGFTGFVPARLVPGRHTTILAMTSTDEAPDCFVADEIEIKMYRKKGYEFLPDLAQTIFPHEKVWRKDPEPLAEKTVAPNNLTTWWNNFLAKWNTRADHPLDIGAEKGLGPGYARIGEVRVSRESHDTLELEVHYVYDPQQSRFAELLARTYLAPYSPDHIRNLGVRLKPGFNTTIVKIERSVMAPVEFKTDKIRMVIIGNFLTAQEDHRLAVYETFTYPKTWSKFPVKELQKGKSDQPLQRDSAEQVKPSVNDYCANF